MLAPGFVHRRAPYTFTAPSGAVIVVLNVPSDVYVDHDGAEETSYSYEVSKRLHDLVKAALAKAEPGKPYWAAYDDEPTLPSADYEFAFSGKDATFSGASIQTWRLLFDKTYNAIKTAIRGSGGKIGLDDLPRVAFVSSGSIKIGVRTSDQEKLVPFEDSADIQNEALQMLMQASICLWSGAPLPEVLTKNDHALEAVLRAIEELSPANDALETVTFTSLARREVAIFSRKLRAIARDKRIDLRLRGVDDSSRLQIFGEIWAVSKSGSVKLKKVTGLPETWQKDEITCFFKPELLTPMLENFGKQVGVTAILLPKKKNPEALDVVRADSSMVDRSNGE